MQRAQSGDDPSDVCLHLKKNADGDGNTFKMGDHSCQRSERRSVNVGLTNVGLTAGGDFKATSGNTITVKFEPHDFRKAASAEARRRNAEDTRP